MTDEIGIGRAISFVWHCSVSSVDERSAIHQVGTSSWIGKLFSYWSPLWAWWRLPQREAEAEVEATARRRLANHPSRKPG
jgi:hypothetical protein